MSGDKRNQKRNLGGCVSHGKSQKMTPRQAEVLAYLQTEGLTVAQVAARRGWSKQYVRKVRVQLRNYGLLSKVAPPPLSLGGDLATPATKSEGLPIKDRRLHAQKFRIEILKPVPARYVREVAGKVLKVDDNDVQCFEGVVCVQAAVGRDFLGVDEDAALESSMEYWMGFFVRLENVLGVRILKSRKQNVTMTYAEWATGPCELSRECEKRAERIRLYALDGKLRYSTDMSLGPEREAHHFRMGKGDSEVGNRFIEDVLDHPEAPRFSELVKVVMLLARENREAAAGLHSVVELLRPSGVVKERVLRGRPDYVG